ncbi:hypothetical protein RE428_48810 (plasmid) [Marinobacter nanhaiticus D15-8W]|uniref:Uncharacterized protein n=1 Tax=Marinobacter nanhaiticus D15-8W TaxID=626887 RepID=N6W3M0_9GAMM|nr:hypothetical protein J057_00679 [Marinobacter nanhaiticus D15-8W]BES73863.1 hypothetical protein RE428_48810 [Marinobacter nanhaiticus D15-8W]
MREKPAKRQKAAPTNISLPVDVSQDTKESFVDSVNAEDFFGRPSKSLVIRALCELALERKEQFDPAYVVDYESLKAELRRILTSDAKD